MINPIPGTPDAIWNWTADPQLAQWQNRVSTGMAIAGVAGTAMGQLELTKMGLPQSMVFFDLLARLA